MRSLLNAWSAVKGTCWGYWRTAKAVWNAGPVEAVTMLTLILLAGFLPALGFVVNRGLVSAILDAIGQPDWWRLVVPWLGYLLLLRVGAAALDQLRGPIQANLTESVEVWIQSELARRVADAELVDLQSDDFQNRIARARAITGADLVQIISDLTIGTQQLVGAIALGAALWYVHPLIMLFPAVGGVAAWYSGSRFAAHIYAYDRAHTLEKRQQDALAHILTDRTAAKEVRLYQAAPLWIDRWQRLANRVLCGRLDLLGRARVRRSGLDVMRGALYGVSLGVLVREAVLGGIETGSFVAALAALGDLEQLWYNTAFQLQYIGIAMLGLRGDLYEFVDQPIGEEEPKVQKADFLAHTKATNGAAGEPLALPVIELRDVSFSYPNQAKPALQNISLRLHPGERVGLVGPNGSGKSTLARILLGLLAPTSGEILVDGRPLDPKGREAWVRQCSAVFQDFVSYHLRAFDNIHFGDLDRPDRVPHAAMAAEADKVIEGLPQQYETLLGPTFGGRDLSGGEWQRLATARAFMPVSPQLVVLDEPTAAADPLSELALYRRFAALSEGRISVLISHRLASARQCDRIVVLMDGRIVEEGTHDELVKANGHYARMFAAQAQWYQ